MNIIPPQKDKEIEKAIILLVDCVKKNNRNPKPLILHSVRVGMKLFDLSQPKEVIVAGILHDIIEDTNCKIGQIKKDFGLVVANLISALTQEDIEDYKKRWHVLLNKIKKAGKEAMIIKVVDNNDNLIHYLPLVKDRQTIKESLWKHYFTIASLKPYLADIKVFKEYCKNYKLTALKLRRLYNLKLPN